MEGELWKYIGAQPMYFPEELIQAAGILPTAIPESDEPVTIGYRSIYGVTAKRPRNDHIAPFAEAKSSGKMAPNVVFAVPPRLFPPRPFVVGQLIRKP